MRDYGQDLELEKQFFYTLRQRFMRDNEPMPVSGMLQRAAQIYADLVALECKDLCFTYQQLYARSIAVTKKLQTLGIQPGDRFLLLAENSVEFYAVYFGILQAGAVVIPVNTFLHELELAHIITDAQARGIFATPSLEAQVRHVQEKKLIEATLPFLTVQDIVWDSIDQDQCAAFVPHERLSDSLAVLLYTSGTSGKPKGVMLSSHNVLTNTMQCFARFKSVGLADQESFFCVLPLFHVFAQTTCLWLPLMTGSRVIVVPKIDRKMILDGLHAQPTIFFGFPALYGLLCLMKTAPLQSVKLFVSGADAMPDKIRIAFSYIYGRKIAIGYGLSEAAPVVAINHYNETKSSNTVGMPLVGIDCQIRDDQGQVLGVGQVGTLWIRGDNVMMGYYRADEMTQAVLQQGWLNTGDLAVRDDQGGLSITGRSKDLIIHKGFNIYPQEVENILLSHPMVIKAAVVGKDDPMTGQIPIAYVAVKGMENIVAIESQLRALCIDNLAAYKVPRVFTCLPDLPMSPTGKIDKKQLIRNND